MPMLVAVLLALLLAVSAEAKVLHHPAGDVVDSRGVLIGKLVGSINEPEVLLHVKGLTFALRVHQDGFEGFADRAFTSLNCSGPGFFSGGGLLDYVEVRDGVRVYGPRVATGPRRITVRSVDRGGWCDRLLPIVGPPVNGSFEIEDAYPATLLIDLTGRWVPPFRIR